MDVLAPPPGARLERAIATTFTLDLVALLTAPLAFSLIEHSRGEGDGADPLALLDAARRHAGRIAVFADAGHIAVPRAGQPLFSLLEESVVPVRAPRPGALFHPKLWLVRYAGDGPPWIRLICPTRNLTFDATWDTCLVLNGRVGDEPSEETRPLADLVAALPELATAPVPERVRADVAALRDDVARTRFVPPDGFDSLRLIPLGLEDRGLDPFAGRIDRLLVMSPFVAGSRLARLGRRGTRNILISRPEELVKVDPEALAGFEERLVVNDYAVPEPEDTEEEPSGSPEVGLHAKLYVADAGREARVWTGSANATDQAFTANVELLVELRGRRSRCGVEAVLREGGREGPGLRDLLTPYAMHAEAEPPDPGAEGLRALLEGALGAVVTAPLRARAVPVAGPQQSYDLQLWLHATARISLPEGCAARCWPVTMGELAAARPLPTSAGSAVRFTGLGLAQLTSFIAIELRAERGGEVAVERLVLNVPLTGVPAHRTGSVLASVIRDRRDLLRFLLMLLAADETAPAERVADLRGLLGGEWGSGREELALLEPLLRALARDPSRVDRVAELIEDMSATPQGRERLPSRLTEIWEPIVEARRRAAR